MLTLQTFFQSLGITRDSALWMWGKCAGTVLFLASLGTDATALGVPESWLKGIQVLALWITYISAQNSTSALVGQEAVAEAIEFDMKKWIAVLEKVAPAVLAVTPAAPVVPFVVAGMKLAEQIPNASGDQKKQFVLEFVKLAGKAAESLEHPERPAPLSPPLVPVASPTPAEDISQAIDTVVDIVNLIQRKL